MVLVEKTVKVSSKGQITLPKQAREMLGGAMIHMVVESGQVRLEPARDLAGSLRAYARKKPLSPRAQRDAAWTEAVREKHGRG